MGCGDLVEDGDLDSGNVVHTESDLGCTVRRSIISSVFTATQISTGSLPCSRIGLHLGRGYWSDVLKYLILDIIAGGIVNPSQGKICLFQRGTHHLLIVHDLKRGCQALRSKKPFNSFTCLRIIRIRTAKASAFFLRSLCPVLAPFSLAFVEVRVLV